MKTKKVKDSFSKRTRDARSKNLEFLRQLARKTSKNKRSKTVKNFRDDRLKSIEEKERKAEEAAEALIEEEAQAIRMDTMVEDAFKEAAEKSGEERKHAKNIAKTLENLVLIKKTQKIQNTVNMIDNKIKLLIDAPSQRTRQSQQMGKARDLSLHNKEIAKLNDQLATLKKTYKDNILKLNSRYSSYEKELKENKLAPLLNDVTKKLNVQKIKYENKYGQYLSPDEFDKLEQML